MSVLSPAFRLAAVATMLSASVFAQSVPPASAPATASAATKATAATEAPLPPAALKARYPAGSIASVEHADRAIADAKLSKQRIEKQFQEDEKACYKTFLANQCVTEAKARRRKALAEVKPVQVEADRFKRRDKVVKRDKALEDKRLKEEGKTRPPEDDTSRVDRFQDKHQQADQKTRDMAAKRAENEAAFARKQEDRAQAQEKVEEKKARTERRREKKAKAAAKRANPPSAPSTPVRSSDF